MISIYIMPANQRHQRFSGLSTKLLAARIGPMILIEIIMMVTNVSAVNVPFLLLMFL